MKYLVEYIDPELLRKLQEERLQDVSRRLYNNVPYYRGAFDALGIKPQDIHSLDDLKHLPLTDKETLRTNYPFGMFALPMQQVTEIHASSGTTGKPTVVAYTTADIRIWSEVMARSIYAVGGRENDIIQNAYGYGLFTGGLGVHYGSLDLGATVVPMSSGGSKRQLQLMEDFQTTILTCTPSYAVYLAEIAESEGIDPRRSSLKIGIHGAEPWSDAMRREIEDKWAIKAYDIYGLSEIIGPGVAIECEGQDGLHIWADHFLPEIIDPKTGKAVPDGEDGMLVITTLTKQA
ncbi:MAG: phenylacetate--CoA ligase, partial [Calditrichaeota bacterium]